MPTEQPTLDNLSQGLSSQVILSCVTLIIKAACHSLSLSHSALSRALSNTHCLLNQCVCIPGHSYFVWVRLTQAKPLSAPRGGDACLHSWAQEVRMSDYISPVTLFMPRTLKEGDERAGHCSLGEAEVGPSETTGNILWLWVIFHSDGLRPSVYLVAKSALHRELHHPLQKPVTFSHPHRDISL